MKIPSFVKKYFWDIDTKKSINMENSEYIIGRILELGDRKAFTWIKSIFGIGLIRKVIKSAKLSPKSKNFWQNV
jgi:hypothetical protein